MGTQMNRIFRNAAAGIFTLLMAVCCATGISERVSFEDKLAERGFAIAQPVSQEDLIKAGLNTGWSFVDGGAAIIYFGKSRQYLVTVNNTCEDKLRNAKRIRFRHTIGSTTEPDRLDIVGRPVRGSSRLYCKIETIYELKKIESY